MVPKPKYFVYYSSPSFSGIETFDTKAEMNTWLDRNGATYHYLYILTGYVLDERSKYE